MKRLFVILLLLSCIPVYSQMNYGVKGGITIANETWEYTPRFARSGKVDAKSVLNLGVFAEYSDQKYVSVIAELNYRQKGAKIFMEYTGRDTSMNVIVPKNIDHQLAYLNISLLGKVKYPVLPFLVPYIIGGLKTDYQVSNNFDDIDLGYLSSETTKQIWGAIIGGGFEVKDLLPFAILAEVRYEFDFNKLYVADYFQFKNNTLEFRLGVRF